MSEYNPLRQAWARLTGVNLGVDSRSPESGWVVESDTQFLRARAHWPTDELEIVFHVELARQVAAVRVYTEIVNQGPEPRQILSFPVWSASLGLSNPSELHWWDALSYAPEQTELEPPFEFVLHSQTYSSDSRDSPGQVPFWMVAGGGQGLGFGLEWCGGWQTDVRAVPDGLELVVFLPPGETQLTLAQEERITGPALQIIPVQGTTQGERRREWLRERQALADQQWPMPEPGHPLIYNHWYSVRFDLSANFIRNQVAAMAPYGFDAFVVDAGWYAAVGDWTADPAKFKPHEFADALQVVDSKGIQTGLWTCPWLRKAETAEALPPDIDKPPFRNRFMDAYTIDLAGTDFASTLDRHITDLEQQFGMDWWKYDQEFVGSTSRHGRMKQISALQHALETVRRNHPHLTVENCMSGGRMINAFTDAIAQLHWIRDGGGSGYDHGRSNILEALGAVQFLAPAKVQRWTNRPDTLDASNPELLKWYCRSCMIGVWGVSADLHRVSDPQREVILREVEHYRALNRLKESLHYEVRYPQDNSALASIVFYDDQGLEAGVLAFRWGSDAAIQERLPLPSLRRDMDFVVIDYDQETVVLASGQDLAKAGLEIALAPGELSRIFLVSSREEK